MARKKPKRSSTKTRASLIGPIRAEYCRTLPGTTEDIKWHDDLVFSIGGKMYAGFDVEPSDQLGFKCTEEDFERLIKLDGIIPAPYAARFFWVKVEKRGALPVPQLKALIRRSYELVLEKLPARIRDQIPAR